ncbi:iron chelate uptake ABC transporter family permease subunit [Hoeflea sp. CAU 1731]
MPGRRLLILFALLALSCVFYLTYGARGDIGFALQFRGPKLVALMITGAAIAVSTKLFQTVTGNRILTPAIMGFDSLYVLIEITLLFSLGGFGYAVLGESTRFSFSLVLMIAACIALFGTLMRQTQRDLHRMILVGIIFGILFRSISGLLVRMIDPNEYAVLQSNLFANFNQMDLDLIGLSSLLIGVAIFAAWRMRNTLDTLELGREISINLGLDHDRLVLVVLGIVALLAAVSTALVGPIIFFGLIVTSLAHQIVPSFRHRDLLPGTILIACIVLVAGQSILERVFHLDTTLSVVIDLVGGLTFLVLILRGNIR